MNSFAQGSEWVKFWQENQKSLFQSWAEGKGLPPGFATGMPSAGGNAPDAMRQMHDLFKQTMDGWSALAQMAWPAAGADDSVKAALKKLFDPAEWSGTGSGAFDMALGHLTEGPTYATLWDLDRKILLAQKCWVERSQAAAAYQAAIQKAWNEASERFIKALSDSSGKPVRSGRELLDLWIATANETLLEMHRSPDFLEAQRRMTRASAEYRLQEREIAEVFCDAHHIPTRTEMDEVQRTVAELRRELRSLKKRLADAQDGKSSQGSK